MYYLNQGTSAEGFWATDGMGLRLADGTTELADGDYIVRIGDKAGNIVEIPFTVADEVASYMPGDVNNDSKINIDDVTAILNDYLGVKKITDDAAYNAANVYPLGAPDDKLNIDDVTAVLNDYLGVKKLSQ